MPSFVQCEPFGAFSFDAETKCIIQLRDFYFCGHLFIARNIKFTTLQVKGCLSSFKTEKLDEFYHLNNYSFIIKNN